MSSATPLHDVSPAYGGFYSPRYELLVSGEGLATSALRDVVEVKYHDDVEALDYLELTVSNWDSERRQFKYIGSETTEALQGGDPRTPNYTMFEPCAKTVQLSMGYSGVLKPLISATFTTMEPAFSSSGPPVLKVRGLNALHQLRRRKYSEKYENMRDSDIALRIAQLEDGDGEVERFPLQVEIDDAARAREPELPLVTQRAETDIDFLWKRARERGYVVTIREGQRPQDRRLYFGPSSEADANPFELRWGHSLIEFNPRLTTANQYRSVTVNGWDRTRQRAIREQVALEDDDVLEANPDLRHLIQACDPREELVVDRPVFTPEQARAAAIDLLTDQSKQMVKASGSTVGLPELRAGTRIRITGVGARLSGTYFLTSTDHTINDSGYLTRFEARRELSPSESNGASS
ncbi:MAG: contractile injection system protein, VgrG/Pvc8 family [Pseudomonadota bacterium]